MEMLFMQWRCLKNALPIPNSIIMIGEIDEGQQAENLILCRTLYYLQIAEFYGGALVIGEPDEFNYPDAKKGKIVLQFHMAFQDEENMKGFIEEISP